MGQSIVIHGLIKKRGEIARQHKVAMKAADTLKADLDAIDRALVLCSIPSRDRQPFDRLVRCRIVANADSIGLLVRMLCQC
jgi:hypothetical protein